MGAQPAVAAGFDQGEDGVSIATSAAQETVTLWEELRPKQTSPEQKVALVGQIMAKVGDRLLDLAANHTASRVLQFCVKHGSEAQRAQVTAQVRREGRQIGHVPHPTPSRASTKQPPLTAPALTHGGTWSFTGLRSKRTVTRNRPAPASQ